MNTWKKVEIVYKAPYVNDKDEITDEVQSIALFAFPGHPEWYAFIDAFKTALIEEGPRSYDTEVRHDDKTLDYEDDYVEISIRTYDHAITGGDHEFFAEKCQAFKPNMNMTAKNMDEWWGEDEDEEDGGRWCTWWFHKHFDTTAKGDVAFLKNEKSAKIAAAIAFSDDKY